MMHMLLTKAKISCAWRQASVTCAQAFGVRLSSPGWDKHERERGKKDLDVKFGLRRAV